MRRSSLGQHFLHDKNIIRKILDLADIKPNERVLEIGAGRGILTQALAHRAKEVITIEIDRSLGQILKTKLAPLKNIRLTIGDALEYDYASTPHPFKVVANLPYYAATPLLFRLLALKSRIPMMVLMMQKEVANRLISKPGGKSYSSLSIAVQYFSDPQVAFKVSRTCFSPPPRVDSVVMRLSVREQPSISVLDEGHFMNLVRAAFAHRRKVMRNSLLASGFSRTILDSCETKAGIDLSRRAETVGLEEFGKLSDILFELKS